MRCAIAIGLALAAQGCGAFGGSCDLDPDLTGRWVLTLVPGNPDGGSDQIPTGDSVTADLMQKSDGNLLGVGRRLWGSVQSMAPAFFGTLTIPPLLHNDGSKTGSELGCALAIKIPVATDVHDDNSPQPPNRLSLFGKVVARGVMVGDGDQSYLILTGELSSPTPRERHFTWTGARQ